MPEDTKPIILYAEDDLDDFEALQDALQQITSDYTLIHVKHGEETIRYLSNESNVKPSLIVLDLNMPIMDGKEVLKWVKNEAALKEIPVIIFTTSSREDDIRLCQSYNCSFFRKPTLYRDLLHIAQVMLTMCDESKR